MAVYHTPLVLTRAPQAVGPYTDKVTMQPQGGSISITDNPAVTAGEVGIAVADFSFIDLPVGETLRVWSSGPSNILLVMMKALA